jgi:hypothetical protein
MSPGYTPPLPVTAPFVKILVVCSHRRSPSTEIERKLDNACSKTGSISISTFTPQCYRIFPVNTDASRRVT